MTEGVNIEPAMTTGSGAMTEAPVVQRRSARAWSGGPLARAVARAPVSVRTKLLAGFGIVVLLLVVVAAAGLLALRQGNSRVQQLRTDEEKATLVQELQANAGSFQTLAYRRAILTPTPGTGGGRGARGAYYFALDDAVSSTFGGIEGMLGAGPPGGGSASAGDQSYLQRFYPAFTKRMTKKVAAAISIEQGLSNLDGEGRAASASASRLAKRQLVLANWFVNALGPITRQAQSNTNQLVAENRTSFATSRNLLLGVSAGSLAVALALALLISSSLLAPLRKTGTRMAEIAAGDFTGHLEVPNRDEIGTLAANVNQLNDELGRLYRELETASRHKSDFLATMSHELRTPLNAIIGFSEVLNEQMFGELNERQLAYVDDIVAAGQHLLSLINDVLDLAKIEAGRIELEPTKVAIPDLLRSATSMQAESAERGGIQLGVTTDPEEITVIADERRVRQVVFNLLSNAIKFTPTGGHVDVSARRDNGLVEIAIADTGPGIPRDDQEAIFQEFEQSPSSKGAEGTGLGLPLSRKLVELHGGRLWLESEVGGGSTFRFTLPLKLER